MGDNALLAGLFDEKIVAVLSCLLQKKAEFGVRELARDAKVSPASTFRILQKMTNLDLLSKRKIGKSVFYVIRKDAKMYATVYNLLVGRLLTPLDVLGSELKELIGAENFEIIKTGQGNGQKVFVISDKVSASMHNDLSAKIVQATGVPLAFVAISIEQARQMRAAGIL